MRWGSRHLWEAEVEKLEWVHKRRASTWDWEEEVTNLLTQIYFWYVSLLGSLTCLLYLPKPSRQAECASLPWEHRTVWGQCDFQCNRNSFHSTGHAELYLVTSSTFSGAIWVIQTMWSHLSLWSFYFSDQAACPMRNDEASYVTHPPRDSISPNLRGGFAFSLQPFHYPFVAPSTVQITKEFFKSTFAWASLSPYTKSHAAHSLEK